MSHVDRRSFLAVSAATGATVASALTPRQVSAQPADDATRTRLSVYDPRARQTIESYRRGVAEMRKRSDRNPNDPVGWKIQAAIHGGLVPMKPTIECEHAVWWFLPWHRAYIYYFERIVRRLSGDSTFALPYWDWNKTGRKALPPAFRDAQSALYDTTRLRAVNRGNPLSGPELDVSGALGDRVFESTRPRQGFGGSTQRRIKGRLENPPHDTVHVRISGNMGDPPTAALDPIFWLHHCNVDRLWEAWRARGGDNPTDDAWTKKPFTFFDENGREVSRMAGEFADTATLPDGYAYDELEGQSPFLLRSPELRAQVDKGNKRVVVMAAPNDEAKKAEEEKRQLFGDKPRVVLAGPADTATVLGAAPVTVEAKLGDDKPKVVAQALKVAGAAPDNAPQIVLTVEGVTFDGPPGVVFRVFINRQEATATTDTEDANYVGSIALFGKHKHGAKANDHAAHEMGETFSFDITNAVRELKERGEWDERNVKVTLTPVGVGTENAPKSKVTFKGISLSVEQ